MIQDPNNRYINAILSQCALGGKDVLEIGCGKGRITRDLACHARHVVASDPDLGALETARTTISAENVTFMEAPGGMPDLPNGSFDVVIYTLSLHHVPIDNMTTSLNKASALLKSSGVIVVLEPGEGGSFTLAKETFGAGSGDERVEKEAAIQAMRNLGGWIMEEPIHFYTQFRFDNDEDFLINMLPGYQLQSQAFVDEIRGFLRLYQTAAGIILDAGRRLNVLRPDNRRKQS